MKLSIVQAYGPSVNCQMIMTLFHSHFNSIKQLFKCAGMR